MLWCPDWPALDTRAFEPVVAAVAELAPRVEVLAPGTLALPTRGPSRYVGGDHALVERVVALATGAGVPPDSVRVGVADGLFAAVVAARQGQVVAVGTSADFLAPLPISLLASAPTLGAEVGRSLAEVLSRLGLTTLGAFAALSTADVVGRFGTEGASAHRLARGVGDRALVARVAPPELVITAELDPPATHVEAVAFLASTLAVELADRLGASGLACTRVAIEAETEHGETLSRLWRHEGALGPTEVAERTRWQIDGWLHGRAGAPPTGGITLIRLVPDEVLADHGRQLGFWGERTEADERAARAVARVQGLLGPDAVVVPERRGGRAPGERVAWVSASSPLSASARAPWPGHLPAPTPALVHAEAIPVEVIDADGEPVTVSGRGAISAPPARVSLSGGAFREVCGWAGPWPVHERWWDSSARRRVARAQVVTDDGVARLLALEGGRWRVEATYD